MTSNENLHFSFPKTETIPSIIKMYQLSKSTLQKLEFCPITSIELRISKLPAAQNIKCRQLFIAPNGIIITSPNIEPIFGGAKLCAMNIYSVFILIYCLFRITRINKPF